LFAVFLVSPFVRLSFEQGVGDLAERWFLCGRSPVLPTGLDRIAAGSKDLPSLIPGSAGLSKPNSRLKRA
jgi:hypothetical protein